MHHHLSDLMIVSGPSAAGTHLTAAIAMTYFSLVIYVGPALASVMYLLWRDRGAAASVVILPVAPDTPTEGMRRVA